ncbi:MAG: hypothetical protein J6I55_02510 [Ruminococcus sp.]|nr:hypothetical protein [Ruminococcus sp.]
MKWTKLSERIIFIDNKNNVAERDKTAEYYSNGIKIRVVYPDSVNDTIRQQKGISKNLCTKRRKYDISKPISH